MAYSHMLPLWAKVQTILDGTPAMREAGEAYLPMHPNESDDAYNERRNRNTLFNMTELTLNSWVGRPFGKPLKLVDVPEVMLSITNNIDLLGNHLQVFCRNWFREGLAKAYSHCYIDFPRVQQEGVRTLAQDREEHLRPYWIHYSPEQVIFVDLGIRDGREVLQEVRIKEQLVERDGFAEVVVKQIRRIFLDNETVTIQLYQEERRSRRRVEWVIVDEYTISLPFIPMVTFYANRSGPMLGKPPLDDLVDLNVAHWQSTSDQRACLTVARFPILACSGGTDESNKLVVGPNRWLYTPDPQGKFYYVEHTGAALNAGEKDLATLEAQMAEYGAEFLRKRPNQTATARILDTVEATSPLQDVSVRFQSAINEALRITGQWMKMEKPGTVELFTDFSEGALDQSELQALTEARRNRDISRVGFLRELQRKGIIAENFDVEADGELIKVETMDLLP